MTSQKREAQVFYNSACPVCDWGIKLQRHRCHAIINWQDLHGDNELCENLGVDIERARKYLHVLTGDGRQHVGIDAFIVLWRTSPSQGWMADLLSKPLLHHPAKIAYFLFANGLWAWNKLLCRW